MRRWSVERETVASWSHGLRVRNAVMSLVAEAAWAVVPEGLKTVDWWKKLVVEGTGEHVVVHSVSGEESGILGRISV